MSASMPHWEAHDALTVLSGLKPQRVILFKDTAYVPVLDLDGLFRMYMLLDPTPTLNPAFSIWARRETGSIETWEYKLEMVPVNP